MSSVTSPGNAEESLRPGQIVLVAKPAIDLGALNATDFANSILIKIDGYEYLSDWGERNFQLAPGRHVIFACIKNVLCGQRGKAQLVVDLKPGETLFLDYRLRGITIFSPGVIEFDRVRNAAMVVEKQKQCVHCGCAIPASAVFCPGCGGKQPAQETSAANGVRCPSCGHTQISGKFCTHCGAPLTQ